MRTQKKSSNKSNKKTKSGIAPGKNMRKLEIRLIPSYPRQVTWDVWLPALPTKYVTTVTSGLIAASIAVTNTNIGSFGTRFGSTFVESRIVEALCKIRFYSSTNPGVMAAWYDEKSTATPTLVEAQERAILSLSCSSIDRSPQLRWTAADPLDLQYTAVGSAATPVTFKFFTNNANFGSSIVATDYFEVLPFFRIQFRGLAGV